MPTKQKVSADKPKPANPKSENKKPLKYSDWVTSNKPPKPKINQEPELAVTSDHLKNIAEGRKALRAHAEFTGYTIAKDGTHHIKYNRKVDKGREEHHVFLHPDCKASHHIRIGADGKDPVTYSTKTMSHEQLNNHLKKVAAVHTSDKVKLRMQAQEGHGWGTPFVSNNKAYSP